MRTQLLKRLDPLLTTVGCLIGSALPKGRGVPAGKTLILRPGGMGDLICADIALGDLGLDSTDFSWLIEQRSRDWAVYRRLPHLCYDSDPVRVLREVWGRYDRVINSEQYFGLSQAYALLARAKGGTLFSFASNRGAAWSDKTAPYDWRDRHEIAEFAGLFSLALGHGAPPERLFLRARKQPADGQPLLLVAGRQSPSRSLDLDGWVSLAQSWHRQRPFLIAATPQDGDFADQLVARFAGRAQRVYGGFAELCTQIARSPDILTIDGGGVHIASYFGVPTLALFTSGRDKKWQPLGSGSKVLRRTDLPCQPCTQFGQVPPCPHRHACLTLNLASVRDVEFSARTGSKPAAAEQAPNHRT